MWTSVLRARDSIQLRDPDGKVLNTHIVSVELLCGPEGKCRLALLLPRDVTKEDIPNGTEIWYGQ